MNINGFLIRFQLTSGFLFCTVCVMRCDCHEAVYTSCCRSLKELLKICNERGNIDYTIQVRGDVMTSKITVPSLQCWSYHGPVHLSPDIAFILLSHNTPDTPFHLLRSLRLQLSIIRQCRSKIFECLHCLTL